MDSTELIKATPALQHIVTTIVAGVPIAEILKSIIVPSTEVIGKRMANRVDRLFEKTGKMVEDAGFTPQPVPEKILLPLLQSAALEEDENLHEMWAALLANAASLDNASNVRPGFVGILKQMTPQEAAILNELYQEASIPVTAENEFRRHGLDLHQMSSAIPVLLKPRGGGIEVALIAGLAAHTEAQLSVESLLSQQLVNKTYWREDGGGVFTEVEFPSADQLDYTFTLTIRGRAFLEACRPPKLNQNG